MSAQGVGNYSDPTSISVESFPLAYTGAIVTSVVSLVVTVASVIVLVCLVWQCYTIRRCVCAYVHACVRTCLWVCMYLRGTEYSQAQNKVANVLAQDSMLCHMPLAPL